VKLAWFLATALCGGSVFAEPVRPPTKADQRRIVAILDVRVSEGVPVEVAQQFQRDLDRMIDPKHYWLAPFTRVHELMTNSTKWTDGCVIGPCIAEVHTQTGADVALIAALSGSGTSFGSVVTLVRTDNGHVLKQEAARCEVCTLNEALATAERASVKLLDSLPAKLPDETAAQRAALAPLETKVESYRHAHAIAGYTLLFVGLAAAAAGVALYEVEAKPPYGLGIAGAGAGFALGGAIVLSF
jgi:hypothetical protein